MTGVVRRDAGRDDAGHRRRGGERRAGAADPRRKRPAGGARVRAPADLRQSRRHEVLTAESDELAGDAHRVDDRVGELGARRGLTLGSGPAQPGRHRRDDGHRDRSREQHDPDARLDDEGDRRPEDDAHDEVDRGRDPLRERRGDDFGVGDESAQHLAGAGGAEPAGDERLEHVEEPEPEPAEQVEGDVVDAEPFEVAGDPPAQRERLHKADGDAEDEDGRAPGRPGDEPSRCRQEPDAAGGADRARHARPDETAWCEPEVPHRADADRHAAAATPVPTRGRCHDGLTDPLPRPPPPAVARCPRCRWARAARRGRTCPPTAARPGRRGPPPRGGA